nr:MAG TPA: hypothetical protein [Caudoviricetes sp.]
MALCLNKMNPWDSASQGFILLNHFFCSVCVPK